ncbi:hypothetical protein S40293_11165 [Stachybotrys chartarum IBT 40293]|nr:hypothetical protein S40293_11165 [Stachybotrys chartarum IBT 40293]
MLTPNRVGFPSGHLNQHSGHAQRPVPVSQSPQNEANQLSQAHNPNVWPSPGVWTPNQEDIRPWSVPPDDSFPDAGCGPDIEPQQVDESISTSPSDSGTNVAAPEIADFSALRVEDCGVAAVQEAKLHIKTEIKENPTLEAKSREALERALSQLSRLPCNSQESSNPDNTITDNVDFFDPSMFPSAEALCFLLSGKYTVTGSFHSELASLVSKRHFERMAFSLIKNLVQGHTRVEFIVCVNFFALTSAVGLETEGQTVYLQDRLKNLQKRYRRNAMTALNHISVLNPPSISLLQALLSGAMLFQMAGSISKCAQLSAAACIVCAQLGGQYFAQLASGVSEEDSLEVRQCLGHCYILDKALAMALSRRPFLPEMDVNTAILIPPAVDMPSTPIFNIYIDFAKVQDSVARDLRSPSYQTKDARSDMVKSLCSQMEDIRTKIRKFRSHPPHCTDFLLQGEWMGVDFTYFSLMTTIMRLHPDHANDRYITEKYLENARRALSELKNMGEHGTRSWGFRNAYCISVS